MLGAAKGLEKEQVSGTDSPFEHTKILAVETLGAESLHASISSRSLVSLPAISSIAKSLGAVTVASSALSLSLSLSPPHVISLTVKDSDALTELEEFHKQTGVWVEPACSCSLSLVGGRRELLEGRVGEGEAVVVVVCGGRGVSEEMVVDWRGKCFEPPS